MTTDDDREMSEAAEEDFNQLLEFVMRFAERQLTKRGVLAPFGAAIATDGQLQMLASDPGPGDYTSQADLDLLYDGVRADADSLRAVAFVADVRIEEGDAVRIELEHREEGAFEALIPYRRKRITHIVSFGEMIQQLGEAHVWT